MLFHYLAELYNNNTIQLTFITHLNKTVLLKGRVTRLVTNTSFPDKIVLAKNDNHVRYASHHGLMSQLWINLIRRYIPPHKIKLASLSSAAEDLAHG
jgi:hypothetical protein